MSKPHSQARQLQARQPNKSVPVPAAAPTTAPAAIPAPLSASLPVAKVTAVVGMPAAPAPVKPAAPFWFNEQGYLNLNPDVAEAIRRGLFLSPYDHYKKVGRREGRFLADI